MCVHHCEKLYTAVIIGEKLGQSYTKQQKKKKKAIFTENKEKAPK